MENIFEELGIPKKYLKPANREDRFIALVHKSWLKSLLKHSKLIEFNEKGRFDAWPQAEEEIGQSWIKVFIHVYKKHEAKVIPLPRIRTSIIKDDPPLSFPQLMQYISQSNYKNLWKEAYKKYNSNSEHNKESQVTLTDYNQVLREIITRTYGCQIINVCDPSVNIDVSKNFSVNLNVLPALCGVETLNAIFLLHSPYMEHNICDCVTFSPAVLEKCYTKPLFIIYQLLNTLKSLHGRSLTLGDITLSDIYLREDLWIMIFPQLKSNLYIQDIPKSDAKKVSIGLSDCQKNGHKFDNQLKCALCGVRTYDKIQVTTATLEKLCQYWIEGQISNFTYLTALNNLSGRKLGDPNCHHVFPWVTDFASRCGKNWRDLKKSKYRLNKGDRQLDLMYEDTQMPIPHHVSDVLSCITYYVYMARRTPKSVLCKNVRTIWVPAEYPSSIQRMQEWTPDECIPEFFNDPAVFKSTHDDLDDLEVPPWSTSPEEFIEKHREILESTHVSERLHHWIDLTFGYKLSGYAAIKAKNVCLQLVDGHSNLTCSGIVQLFNHPHPPRSLNNLFWGKIPPKIYIKRSPKYKTRDHSLSSVTVETEKSEEELDEDISLSQASNWSPLGISRLLSRSRSSLSEEQKEQKPSRSPSGQRSASVGPKNPTFMSHVTPKPRPNQLSVPSTSLNTGIIYLPKEYNPAQALVNLENKHQFYSKIFRPEEGRKIIVSENADNSSDNNFNDTIQNAFTNRMFTETFEAKLRTSRATKSFTFPVDNQMLAFKSRKMAEKSENLITCNYFEIVAARRIKELQILGCLIVEIFMAKQLRALGVTNVISGCVSSPFNERLKACITVVRSCKNDVPSCVKYIASLLLQPEQLNLQEFKYPSVTNIGLPPPSAHLLLEPLLNRNIPFTPRFLILYNLLKNLKDFENITRELDILYHFDCNGQMCLEYENIERAKILFEQTIGECKVKSCARNLQYLLEDLNTTTDIEIVYLLVPYVKTMIEEPPTSVLAAWYLFDPIARVLGPRRTSEIFLESLLKLYESEPSELTIPYNSKIAKLYHHSFMLRLIVRFGLKCFLDHFVTSFVEAIGGYRDYDKVDFVLHTHEKVVRKTSHLKTIDHEEQELSPSDDSTSSEKNVPTVKTEQAREESEPEVFDFENEDNQEPLQSLIEHLELNVASDLPYVPQAEEALDALNENEQLRSLEELNLNLNENYLEEKSGMISPTIPIPSSYRQQELNNISCEIGSRKSETEFSFDKKSDSLNFKTSPESSSVNNERRKSLDYIYSVSNESGNCSFLSKESLKRKQDSKISDMSCDSLIWLSHRLGPVLTARHLSRNLLKMLTLCYVGKENLLAHQKNGNSPIDSDIISVANSLVIGDVNASKVLHCLGNIAALYGEQLILLQYFPHMRELIALCKRKLTPNLEGGLISCLALLKHIIPYLTDATLMTHLHDEILIHVLLPCVRLLGSTKYTFPSGSISRNVLARKYIDTLYVLSLRMGADNTRTHLAVPFLQRFFLIFEKIKEDGDYSAMQESLTKIDGKHSEETHYVEIKNDGSITEWTLKGKPPHMIPVRLLDSDSTDSLSPPVPGVTSSAETTMKAMDELRTVFTSELAHTSYMPFLKQIGSTSLEISLKNNATVLALCHKYVDDGNINIENKAAEVKNPENPQVPAAAIGSNVALIGNRIDVQVQSEEGDVNTADILSQISNKMENTSRHLRGNWLAYWEHEIGRSEKDTMFNFKQIKLQTFAGHNSSVKSLCVLDNENSFLSGSREKTVKLWSLRSQGDGSSVSTCQWTYTSHRKSIMAITFVECFRLVASCDGIVHIWDPFLGQLVGLLESPKYPPVNTIKAMPAPSSLIFAATTEGILRVIDTRTCSYTHDLKVNMNQGNLIRCLAIAKSGLWIAAGQSSGHITVLDSRTGQILATWRAHESEVLQLVPVGEDTLISSSLDQTICVWNVQDGKFNFHMKGATEPVHCLNLYNSELISGTTANRIGVHTSIDAETSFSSTKLRTDTFKGLLTSMAVLPLNRLLLLGADNGTISLLC